LNIRMNYVQTLHFLYSKLPMFTRIGEAALKKDLHNTIALCKRLGNPQDKFKTIHVAGTNGKGSTSHMLAAIFQQAGYKTGLYTSPHLKDFRERIRINGKMIPKRFVSTFVAEQKETIAEVEPSFFEVTVAMAFSYFAVEQVDIAIIEVGLGGRLDSTNIIHPELALITNISLDHTNILGHTLEEIAFEKAGIIKKGIPIIIGEKEVPSAAIFANKAREVGAELDFASEVLHLDQVRITEGKLHLDLLEGNNLVFKNLQLDLTGTYQLKNVLAVILAVRKLSGLGFPIPDAAIYGGLKAVKKLTGLQGRWQTLGLNPRIICDTGHNVAGMAEVIKNIANTKYEKLHLVIGMVKDKDIDAVLSLLPQHASYYFCQPAIERGLSAETLKNAAEDHGLSGEAFSTVKEALAAAKEKATASDLIFIGGSTFTVAEII
jgi:dihydrofolate synthase/folylpolyglutamate synthase